jgi:hypothetical protein
MVGKGAPEANVLTSGSPMAILKYGTDYSVFITIFSPILQTPKDVST